jgi:hypothetical protein
MFICFDMRFENDYMSFDDMFMKWCFEIYFHDILERLCEEHDSKWSMSMWKHGHNVFMMTQKHKHVYEK